MPRPSASVLYCKFCGRGINILNNDPVFKCLKCNTKPVCSQCYNTKHKACNNCAELGISAGNTTSKSEEKSIAVSPTKNEPRVKKEVDIDTKDETATPNKTEKGDETTPSTKIKRKNIFIAVILAFIPLGLGYMYLREWKRAVIFLTIAFSVMALTAITSPGIPGSKSPFYPLWLLFLFFPVYDCYRLAKKQNALNDRGNKLEEKRPPKNDNKEIIKLAAILILCLMVFGVILLSSRNPGTKEGTAILSQEKTSSTTTLICVPRESPSTVVKTYFGELLEADLFRGTDYEKIFNLISITNRPSDYDQWHDGQVNMKTAWETQNFIFFYFKEVKNEVITEDTAKVTLKYQMKSLQGYEFTKETTIHLVKENCQWKLAEDHYYGDMGDSGNYETNGTEVKTTTKHSIKPTSTITPQTTAPSRTSVSTSTTSTTTITTTTTSTKPPVEATAVLKWVGMRTDEVGSSPSGNGPDGALDGRFSLSIRALDGKTIDRIILFSVDSSGKEAGGAYWDTYSTNNWILGVAVQAGTLINGKTRSPSSMVGGTKSISNIVGGTRIVLILYAANANNFVKGQSFKVIVTFSDGSTAEAITTIPEPPGCPDSPPSYSKTKWDRVWCDKDFTQELSSTPDEGSIMFDDDWGTGSVGDIRPDNIGFRSGRSVNFTEGTYLFTVGADDGVRIWIDDVLQKESWSVAPYRESSFSLFMTEGYHRVRIDYYENNGKARVSFRFEKTTTITTSTSSTTSSTTSTTTTAPTTTNQPTTTTTNSATSTTTTTVSTVTTAP